MKKIKLAVFLLAICLPWALFSQSVRVMILTDASGSMIGFFQTGSIHELHNQLVKTITNTGGHQIVGDYYFAYRAPGGADGLVRYDKSYSDWGRDTFLDRAFDDAVRKAPQSDAIFMITDNIQDPQAGEQAYKSIDNFYRKFQSESVVAAHFFPKVLPFQGPLYARDGRTRIGKNEGLPKYIYDGPRALVIYAIVRRNGIELQAILDEFAKWTTQTAIASKINADAIQVTEEVVPIPPEEARGRHVLILQGGKLVPEKKTPISEGDPIIARFRLRFKSGPENLKITPPVPIKFMLEDEFRFFEFSGAASDFHAKSPATDVTPPQLEAELYPPGDPRNESNQVTFTVTFDKGVRFSKSLGALGRYMFKSQAGDFKGTVRIGLPVERTQYDLLNEIKEKYTTEDVRYFAFPPNPNLQSKVFGLAKMFNQTYESVTYPFNKSYPIVLKVNYPRWPLFALLFIFALIAGLIYLWLRFQPEYVLSPTGPSSYSFKRYQKTGTAADLQYDDDYEDNRGYRYEPVGGESIFDEEKFKLFPIISGHPVRLNESLAATLRRFPLAGVYAFAQSGFRVEDKKIYRLNDIGTSFDVSVVTAPVTEIGASGSGKETTGNRDGSFESYTQTFSGNSGASGPENSSSSSDGGVWPFSRKKSRKDPDDGGSSSSHYGSGSDYLK